MHYPVFSDLEDEEYEFCEVLQFSLLRIQLQDQDIIWEILLHILLHQQIILNLCQSWVNIVLVLNQKDFRKDSL